MKKFVALLISIVTVLTLAACGKKNNSEIDWAKTSLKSSYTIGAVEGAPTLSLVNVADGGFTYTDNNKSVTTNVTIAADAKDILAKMKRGDVDMGIMPVNIAVQLYGDNSKHEFRLATVNVFGGIYMIGNTDVSDIGELKGKVVNCVGYGGTPGLVLKHLLEQNNVPYVEGANATSSDKVFINAISKPAEAKTEYVVLAEPAVTTNIASSQKKVVLDFKKEWQKIHGENSTFTQAGLVVNVSKVNKKYLQALVEHLKENRNYLYNNIADINSKLEAMGATGPIKSLPYTAEILNRCNIDCKTAISMKADIEAFLTANNVELPDKSFYLL